MAPSYDEALGRSALYELLSVAFLYPEQGAAAPVAEKARRLAPVAARLGWQERGRLLEELGGHFRSLSDERLRDEYVEVFGHSVSATCPPYEGEYGMAHIFQKSQTLAELKAFYHAFGVGLNPGLKDRPDHISVELEFMHLLALKEAYAQLHNHGEDKVGLCRQAQEAFLRQHLASWILAFTHRLAQRAENAHTYLSLARLLELHMDAEFRAFQVEAVSPSPSATSVAMEEDQECSGCPLIPGTAGAGGLP